LLLSVFLIRRGERTERSDPTLKPFEPLILEWSRPTGREPSSLRTERLSGRFRCVSVGPGFGQLLFDNSDP